MTGATALVPDADEVMRAAHHAVEAAGRRQACQPQRLPARCNVHADAGEVLAGHAGEHGHGEHLDLTLVLAQMGRYDMKVECVPLNQSLHLDEFRVHRLDRLILQNIAPFWQKLHRGSAQ